MTKAELRAMAEAAMKNSRPITRIEAGVSSGLTDKEWGKVVQSPTRVRIDGSQSDEQRLRIAEGRAELAHDAFFTRDNDFGHEVLAGRHDHLFK